MAQEWPIPPERMPRWGHPAVAAFCRVVLRILGWRIEGQLPNESRLLLTLAPHTSNWDWVIGMLVIASLDLEIHWIGKTTLFRGLWGRLFKAIGGIPVDRKASTVDQIVREFHRRERFLIAMAPEGTRKPVERFRSGFQHIAHRAGVPVLPVYLDWDQRVVGLMDPFHTSADRQADVRALETLYAPWWNSSR